MTFVFYLYFFVPFFVSVSPYLLQFEPYDYCDPKQKLCEVYTDHTMCRFPVAGLGVRCTPSIHEPLSLTEKKRILFWHNKFRSNLANGTEKNKNRKLPMASNMRQMYWDRELEALSTRWAEQCISTMNNKVSDKCRNTKRFKVSQNIGTRRVNASSIDKQAPQIVVTWYKDNKDFDPNLVEKFLPAANEKIRQFANIIWAETYAIGCARVIFQEELPVAERDPKRTSVWTVERLICNYGPGGNEIGKSVYKRGVPCERCPEGTQCSTVFPGLCAAQSADKLEGQQNLESSEFKEEAKTITEMSKTTVSSRAGFPSKELDVSRKKHPLNEKDTEAEDRYFSDNLREEDSLSNKEKDCEGEECWYSESVTKGTTTNSDSRHSYRIEEIINSPRPTGGTYLIKSGIYLNGKCHCSDVKRSAATKQTEISFISNILYVSCALISLIMSYF